MDNKPLQKKTTTSLDEMISTMNLQDQERRVILVLDDIEETRYLIEKMLKANGYEVALARSEENAISEAVSQSPSLILMSLGLEPEQLSPPHDEYANRRPLVKMLRLSSFVSLPSPRVRRWRSRRMFT